MKIDDALKELKKGNIVLIYDEDGREAETDIVVAAEHAKPAHIRTMRKDGGGLICTAVHHEISEKLKLPFLVDIWNHTSDKFTVFDELTPNDIPYDAKSSFSITINHRKTFTGITDKDRSLTITAFSQISENAMNGYDPKEFGKNFRSPGHVILLNASEGLLAKRKGHTELSVALMEMADLTPVATICEMLDDDGGSLSREKAEEYAKKNGLVFLMGRDIIDAYLNSGKASQ